ncbi:MAG TPA: hypothetical protein VM528_07085 [Burkholderiaceae bacterium]|jgi:hypothetical protein|nr:hypothetical protein [Burkholderiaceae bacterium]
MTGAAVGVGALAGGNDVDAQAARSRVARTVAQRVNSASIMRSIEAP